MTSFPSLQRGRLDEVDLLTLPLPGPLHASLIFRAGYSTAEFRTQPVPHLLEHLVLGALPRSPQRRQAMNGSTTAEDLTFEVTGSPELVRDTLHEICAAVRDLNLERLDHEARVVDVEVSGGSNSIIGLHGALRCGMRGAGLEGTEAVPASSLTAEHVADFAARHLVAGNAVLALTGPVPEGLHLDLPSGPRTVISSPRRADHQLPSLIGHEAPLTAMSIETDESTCAALMTRLLQERAENRLRHELGISYGVELERLQLGEDEVLRSIAADGSEEDTQRIAEGLVTVLRELAEHGPTPEELAEDLATLEETLQDPRTHQDLLLFHANRLLNGADPRSGEQMVEELRAVTAQQVRDMARRALDTLLVTVPGEAEVDASALGLPDRTFDTWPMDPELPGTVFARRLLTMAPRDLRVTIGEAGVSVRVAGIAASFPAGELVGIERSGDWLELIRADDRRQSILPRAHRRGAELLREIEERWGHLIYPAKED